MTDTKLKKPRPLRASPVRRGPSTAAIDPRQVDWVSDQASVPASSQRRQARGKRKMVEGEDGKLKMVWLSPAQAAEERSRARRLHSQMHKMHRSGSGSRSRVRRKPHGQSILPPDQVLASVEARYPSSFAKQLLAVVEEFPQWARTGLEREVSDKTVKERSLIARRVPRDLRSLNIRIERLGLLRTRQIVAVVHHWRSNGVSPATVALYASTLRSVLDMVGLAHLVPETVALELFPGEFRRQASATSPKGWRPKGVDQTEVFERVKSVCLHTWHVLRLCSAFGLRVKEGLEARPAEMARREQLVIDRGTKGRRIRQVPILSDEQRQILKEAAEFARSGVCKKGTLTRRGRDIDQDQSHFYYVLSRCGIKASEIGVTPHGLRHDYLTTRFEQVSGVPAPVVGGVTSVVGLPKDVLRDAQQVVSHEAGHARRSISTAYLGSARNIKATEMSQMRDRLQQLEYHAPTVSWLHSVGPGEWFIVGDHAMGRLPMGKRTQLMLAGTLKRLDLVVAGARVLTERIGFPVAVVDISTVDPEAPRLELVSLSLISPANEPVAQPKPKTSEPSATQVAAPVQARLDVDDAAADAA